MGEKASITEHLFRFGKKGGTPPFFSKSVQGADFKDVGDL